MKVFVADDYDFTDSILCNLMRDTCAADYLLTIDLYLGKDKSEELKLRIKNVKRLNINAAVTNGDTWSAYTLSHIEKRYVGGVVELLCYPSLAYLPKHDNDTLLYCLCDEVYIEE